MLGTLQFGTKAALTAYRNHHEAWYGVKVSVFQYCIEHHPVRVLLKDWLVRIRTWNQPLSDAISSDHWFSLSRAVHVGSDSEALLKSAVMLLS